MAIALGEVAGETLFTQAVVLILVGIAITAGVYGVVGLIVKMDDIGLHLARQTFSSTRALGRTLVRAMPIVMHWLSIIGTAAMIWIGGGILVHGLGKVGFDMPERIIHHLAEAVGNTLPFAGGVGAWAITALGSGIIGLIVGGVIVAIIHLVGMLRGGGARA